LALKTLIISEPEVRRHTPGNVLWVCWRQWRAERRLAHRDIHFRETDPAKVAAAYQAMSLAEFDAINGRQDWANWRTIPRALSGHVPDRPLRILDLGCGTGSSTRVLAWYAPAGSHITGYELAEPLLQWARVRRYAHSSGSRAAVDFVCQGITTAFKEPDGRGMANRSVDLVSSSGVVGHHLDEARIAPLIAELRRVLAPGGVAALDTGPTLEVSKLRELMERAGFSCLGHVRSGWWDPTGQMVFARAEAT
jgi:SAM-dependent methyltransferase